MVKVSAMRRRYQHRIGVGCVYETGTRKILQEQRDGCEHSEWYKTDTSHLHSNRVLESEKEKKAE